MRLLTRQQFNDEVFSRDGHKCVVCGAMAVDAHHLMERRLWPDGGYYLDNGVSLCSEHHLDAETTKISPQELRDLAGIQTVVLPPDLTEGKYDKWGNEYLPNGLRTRGPLFAQENVQKVLKMGGFEAQSFTHIVKYPKTPHLPWSPETASDDRILDDVDHFLGKRIVVTEKMDGENANLYSDHFHARSASEAMGEDRAHVKQIWGRIRWEIPEGWRICGENMAALHSVAYEDLDDWLLVFSIWNEDNEALSWEETVGYCEMLDLQHVPVLFEGLWEDCPFEEIGEQVLARGREGYVVRVVDSFGFGEFSKSIAKFVRHGHVQTKGIHWRNRKRVWNKLK